jgi:hypothetical protein
LTGRGVSLWATLSIFKVYRRSPFLSSQAFLAHNQPSMGGQFDVKVNRYSWDLL